MTILCKIRTRRGISSSIFDVSPSNNPRYDFEYEEDDDEEGGDVDIENKYYNAKQMKATDPEAAIEEFLGVPALEKEKGDWGFKGLKQAIKLEFKLGLYDKVWPISKAFDPR
jgi:COP9 signalosome complex subunit 2